MILENIVYYSENGCVKDDGVRLCNMRSFHFSQRMKTKLTEVNEM